jgi:DNA-binding NarL/FixJ family response regulator
MREREVMELLAGGLSNEEIASHLVVSPNTVKFHLRTIYSRLGVRNRVQAVQTVSRRPGIHPSQSTMADGRSSRLARPHTR